MIEISFPTFRHALEDVQKAHEQVFNLVPVQFVAAQHVAAGDGHTLVLERQKTNERKKGLRYQTQTEHLFKDIT